MLRTDKPAYWAVIPASVRYDGSISSSAKLIYAEISALLDARGYCFASNQYFGELYGCTERTVRRWLDELSEAGYITVEIVRDAANEVVERRIWAGQNPAAALAPPSGQKCPEGPDKNVRANNSIINTRVTNPPQAPQGADGEGDRGRKAASAAEPQWKPERFAGFWAFYPCGKSKQAAVKAWDKLRPSDELIDVIASRLKVQTASAEWQRGIGVPYASTYLNQRRWEDEDRSAAAEQPARGVQHSLEVDEL